MRVDGSVGSGSPMTSSRSVQRSGSGRKVEQPVRRSYSSEIESTTDGHDERVSEESLKRMENDCRRFNKAQEPEDEVSLSLEGIRSD